MRSLLLSALALLVFFSAPGPASAANRCVVVQSQQGQERFVNTCGICRSVTVQRSRPGGGVPASRRIDIQAGTVFPSPFRGPGRSRIRSDRPCPGERGGATDLLKAQQQPAAAPEQCVSLEQSSVYGVVLVNRCRVCKAVAIERWSGKSGPRVRDYLEVTGNKSQPVASKGYTEVGLLGELDCRS